jgi:hypothetical protein
MKRINKRLSIPIVATSVLLGAGAARADAVTDWNEIMQMTVAPYNTIYQARSSAIVQLAVFEAVNAIVGDYEPYLGCIAAPPWASPDAAAVAAAHRALVELYPGSAQRLDALRDWSGRARRVGIEVGETAAAAMLALRMNDGSDAMVPYTPGTDPGDWQPTPRPSLPPLPAFEPGWGRVTPFGIEDGAQFRSGPPPALHTRKYARDYDEVKRLGAETSTARPPDRTDVAKLYAVVGGAQLWNDVARQASAAQCKTLPENARNFALLAMALADGNIAVYDTKYHYNYWRPVTAINAGDTDGNKKTAPDPTWLPLIVTPPFPSYPSGHATTSNAARRVLERVYGKHDLDITVTSPMVPGVVKHYTAWEQITDDIDDARIYGGIHFRFDQEAGARLGRHVGTYILRHHLRAVHGDCDPDDDD